MAKTIDPAAARALTDAVRELEACSCAEVVIEIRSRSGSYAQADARFASVIAFVGLLVLLFSPWPFDVRWIAIDVVLAWILGLFVARKSDSARRLMTTRRERVAQARMVAASVFFERGIANTRRESGILLYLGLLEAHVELLADRGVLAAVPTLEWNRIIESSRNRDATIETLVDIVRALQPMLGHCLPVEDDDVDELGNVPRFVSE
jgi:uncharacterized membrane protein